MKKTPCDDKTFCRLFGCWRPKTCSTKTKPLVDEIEVTIRKKTK